MSDKNIKNLEEVTKGYFNVPIAGNPEADEVWGMLFRKNFENLQDKAHSLFLKGFEELPLDEKCIPNLGELESIIIQKTGWKLTPTDDEYSGAEDWFLNLEQKSFLVTKVIRSKENLDYTPFPEAFHDIFGHIPYMHSKEYMDIIHKFSLTWTMLENEEERQKVTNFWWYTIEFGLMKENEKIKAFGAGFMSSFGECNYAFSGKVLIKPFDVEEMKNSVISDHEFHKKFFVIESLDQIEEALDNWA